MTHLDEMIDALGLEVEAIRRRGRSSRLDVRNGERVRQAGGMWHYRFIVADAVNLPDDTPIRIEIDREEVRGTVVSFRDAVLVVALEEDRGPTITRARLSADGSFLVERLKERLEEVRDGAPYFNGGAADRTLGRVRPRVADADPDPSVVIGGNDLNPEQVDAVRRALGSDTTFVWGPPGTGKTTTLARIVEAHYRKGRSVLLVSNTNTAVDTALEQVAKRLSDEPEFDEGLVLRKGEVTNDELRKRFGDKVILDEIVKRVGAALEAEKEHLLRAAEPLEQEEQKRQAILDALDRYSEARHRLARHNDSLRRARENAAAKEAEVKRRRHRATQARQDAQRAQAMGTMRRVVTRVDPERLVRQAAIAEGDAKAAAAMAAAAVEPVAALEAETPALRAEIARLSRTADRYPSRDQIETKLATLRAEIEPIKARISEIDRELAGLEQRIVARCRILATTAYKAYLERNPRQFDVVVIDEASMLMPPLVYFAAGLATESVTVAGDFRQLPPIVISDDPLPEQWLKRDMFRIAGIPERVGSKQEPPELRALSQQYRMLDPICEVANKFFYYDRPLVTARDDPPGQPPLPFGASPLLYVDTAEFKPWAAFREGTRSRYNILHALLVRNVVTHLRDKGYLPADDVNESVGVIAPYRAQADLIQALLDERLGQRAAGIAATVHRFQGNEKRTMIIDLTDSTSVPVGKFLKSTDRDEADARLLNVALSRARDHVILVGNYEYLRAKLPPTALLQKIIEHFMEHGKPIETERLPALTVKDWVDGLRHSGASVLNFPEDASGAFNDQTFYPAFQRDITHAKESIVVFSPFMAEQGVGRWADYFRTAIARGVRVHVHTRPPAAKRGFWDPPVRELVKELRRLNVTVAYRQNMHEKVAIIDERVLWHGSLNILSHNNALESMLRIVGRSSCKQMARNLGANEETNPPCRKCSGETVRMRQHASGRTFFKCIDPMCAATFNK